nr:MarR family winged helix-turn-helix transcriptional regulator [Candidatus Sigynarchaeota archaeon]
MPPGAPPLAEFEKLRELLFMYQIQVATPGGGITGYELKTLFNIPQTSVYRELNVLEGKKFVTAEEKIVDGRAQKRYMLTDEGDRQLKDLKGAIAGKILFLFEILTPEMAEMPRSSMTMDMIITFIKNRIRAMTTKDDALSLLDNFEDFSNHQIKSLERGLEWAKRSGELLAKMKEFVEKMDEYSPDKIIEIIEQEMQDQQQPEE